jgi:hypothetical protein
LAQDGREYKGPFNALTRDSCKEIVELDLENTVRSSRSQSHCQSSLRPGAPPKPLHVSVSAGEQDGSRPTRKSLCADILAQIRRAENKEETARDLDRVSTEELQATLASVITSREYFMSHDFPAAYGDKSERLLETYYQLYGDQGFRTFVAIDDCDVAKFAIAISAATAPQSAPGAAAPAAPRAPRAPLP